MSDSSTPRDPVYLRDIAESARTALFHLGGRDLGEFLGDVTAQDAVIRRLTIIGEAAARIGAEYREANPGLPWRSIIGMRNILVHNYDEINLKIVWKVTREDLPELIEALEKFLDSVSE